MASGSPTRRVPVVYVVVVAGLAAMVFIGCGGGSTGGGIPGATPTPTPVASPMPSPTPAPAAGLRFAVASATVPTGGIFQYQLLLTEPKPIGNSSTRPVMPKGPDGPVRGVAVNDSTGQAVGIAVINGTDISVSVNSPDASLGTDVDYPLLVLTAPVVSTAVGSTFPVALDASSLFFDSGNQYSILENSPGTLTIGGTMSITDVVPGGGVIRPGDTLKILGIGFDATTKIQLNNANLSATNFVSPTEIDVTIGSLCAPESAPCQPVSSMQLDGDRVRAIKDRETVEYFSYDRTDNAPGSSANPLVRLVHPMFSQQLFTVGSFPYAAGGTQFTGIALQNTSTTDATVQIDLLDSAGNALVTPDVELVPARTELVRDIAELFASVPANVATVRATLTTGSPVKMLGMLGDTSNSTVVPVVVTGK
ncbi:MAG TPA: hypothetical protein VFP59_04120 [Candidatus Angelobacter sp.]|nr:hypothetical protein [Candidatus Angelobacter sp.]